jgi:hypothetical protein
MHNNDYTFDKKYSNLIHLPKSGGTTFSKLVKTYKLPILCGLHRPISKFNSVKDSNYILILRNPIDRVLSYRNMIINANQGYPYKQYLSSLSLFMDNCWEVCNQLTLYVAGVSHDELKTKYNNIVDITIYNLALENIKGIKDIILFDNFNSNVTEFIKNKYDITIPIIPVERKGCYSKLVLDGDRKIIEKYNMYDIMLYRYIVDNM